MFQSPNDHSQKYTTTIHVCVSACVPIVLSIAIHHYTTIIIIIIIIIIVVVVIVIALWSLIDEQNCHPPECGLSIDRTNSQTGYCRCATLD